MIYAVCVGQSATDHHLRNPSIIEHGTLSFRHPSLYILGSRKALRSDREDLLCRARLYLVRHKLCEAHGDGWWNRHGSLDPTRVLPGLERIDLPNVGRL